jgi:hypothetical protein
MLCGLSVFMDDKERRKALDEYRKQCEGIKARRTARSDARKRAADKRAAPDRARAAERRADIDSASLERSIQLMLGATHDSHNTASAYRAFWPDGPDYSVEPTVEKEPRPIDLFSVYGMAHAWRAATMQAGCGKDPGKPAQERERARIRAEHQARMREIEALAPPVVKREAPAPKPVEERIAVLRASVDCLLPSHPVRVKTEETIRRMESLLSGDALTDGAPAPVAIVCAQCKAGRESCDCTDAIACAECGLTRDDCKTHPICCE